MGMWYGHNISIKKGRIENTMDKVMIILLFVCIGLIFAVLFYSYKCFSDSINNSAYDKETIDQNSNPVYDITQEGELLINGKPFLPDKPADEYSMGDYMSLVVSLLNQEVIEVGEQDDTIFKLNNIAIYGSIILFIYWIILLFVYEKERNVTSVTMITDEELFEKYNPLIMGCIEGNRNVVPRDIIAVILGLVNKKIIDLKLIPVNEKENNYRYILIRNRSNETNLGMDEIEKYIHCLVFGEPGYDSDEIDLINFVELFSEREDYNKIMKKIQKIVNKKLNSLGANKNKVPLIMKIANTFIFIGSVFLFIFVIWHSFFHIEITTIDIVLFHFAIMLVGFIMPVIVLLIYAGVILFIQSSKIMKRITDKFAAKRVVGITALVVIIFSIIIFITLKFSITPAIIPYELLICMAFLIMKTDNLLVKNDEEIMMDYNRMKLMKEKIQEYSLLNRKEIEHIKLWEFYMTYAVAFGVARKAIIDCDKRMRFEKVDKGYLLDLLLDVLDGFYKVNF